MGYVTDNCHCSTSCRMTGLDWKLSDIIYIAEVSLRKALVPQQL